MVDAAPFEGFTPIMLPHRLVGLSIADLTRDIQDGVPYYIDRPGLDAIDVWQRVAQFGPSAAAAVVLAPILGPLVAAGAVAGAMNGPFGLAVPNEVALAWLVRQGGRRSGTRISGATGRTRPSLASSTGGCRR